MIRPFKLNVLCGSFSNRGVIESSIPNIKKSDKSTIKSILLLSRDLSCSREASVLSREIVAYCIEIQVLFLARRIMFLSIEVSFFSSRVTFLSQESQLSRDLPGFSRLESCFSQRKPCFSLGGHVSLKASHVPLHTSLIFGDTFHVVARRVSSLSIHDTSFVSRKTRLVSLDTRHQSRFSQDASVSLDTRNESHFNTQITLVHLSKELPSTLQC